MVAHPPRIDLDRLKASLLGEGAAARTEPPPVTVGQCAALLKRANEVFRPHLAPLGHSVETFVNIAGTGNDTEAETAPVLAAMLNRMHPQMNPDTMTDRATVDHLQACVDTVLRDGVPGDLIETGVWKGGLTVLMRGVLQARGVVDRLVWVADSFVGMPQPDPRTALTDAVWHFLVEPIDWLCIPQDVVEATFRQHELLDEQVRFLPGWFADTLPSAPIDRLAVLRLDGDWYDSTKCAIETLYPRLSPGGFIEIDDYGLPLGCRQAVDEYRQLHAIDEPIQWVNHQVVCWRKRIDATAGQQEPGKGSDGAGHVSRCSARVAVGALAG